VSAMRYCARRSSTLPDTGPSMRAKNRPFFVRWETLVVDFTQVDERRSREVGRQSLRAYLSMETRPQEVRAEDRYANPLGVTVLRMVLKERT